ncbi:unnamed protein product, partial [marine sediment metagenome]
MMAVTSEDIKRYSKVECGAGTKVAVVDDKIGNIITNDQGGKQSKIAGRMTE